MSGFTLSHRDKWNNPVFRNLLEVGIWSWMCDAAAWKDCKIRFNGKLIHLKRGQLVVSERFLSSGFGVGRQVIRTFLDNLITNQMITREPTHGTTIINICNYDKYQLEDSSTNPPTNHDLTTSQPKANPNKNKGNKDNEVNKDNILSEFEEFWKIYPRKDCKKDAVKKFEIARKKISFEELMEALRKYCDCDKVRNNYIMQPPKWLSGEHWNDEYQTRGRNEKAIGFSQPANNKPSWDDATADLLAKIDRGDF